MVERCQKFHSGTSFEAFQLKLGMIFVLLIVIEYHLEIVHSRADTKLARPNWPPIS